MKLSRRQFLAGLLSVGATLALPLPLAQASAAQVNTAWKQMLKEPWYFEVNDCNTIVEADAENPKIRSDVFDVDIGAHCTAQSLVNDVESCYPLTWHFEQLASIELDEAQWELEDNEDLAPAESRRLKRLVNVLGDAGDGWAEWVLLEGPAGLPRFVEEARQWLASPISSNDLDWLPRNSGAQGQALAFFESLPKETRKALGVVIIEGEHPGSSYFAAELREPIEDANATAEELELPFRFRAEGSTISKMGA